MNYIKRDLEQKIISLSKEYASIIITGPQQVGKTTLLKQLMPKNMEYVVLDDLEERRLAKNDPAMFFDTRNGYWVAPICQGTKFTVSRDFYMINCIVESESVSFEHNKTSRRTARFLLSISLRDILGEIIAEVICIRVLLSDLFQHCDPLDNRIRDRIPPRFINELHHAFTGKYLLNLISNAVQLAEINPVE